MTSAQKKRKPPARNSVQLMALGLMGAGLIILGALAMFLLPKGSAAGEQPDTVSAVPVTVDFPAPELELTDLEGQAVSLADYRGQVVLVNNWATWCPPCKAEMPVLQDYYDRHREQGFTIIAIESGQPAAEVAEFVAAQKLTFPVWPDSGSKALIAFRNNRLPNSYVIDRDGRVRLAWTGAISRARLEKYVTPLLEE